MGAVRTWKTRKEVMWTVFVPDGNSMMFIQRTRRRELVCHVDEKGELWDWSPYPAGSSDAEIWWEDFRHWMSLEPIPKPKPPPQMEFDFEQPAPWKEARDEPDEFLERPYEDRTIRIPAVRELRRENLDVGQQCARSRDFGEVAVPALFRAMDSASKWNIKISVRGMAAPSEDAEKSLQTVPG